MAHLVGRRGRLFAVVVVIVAQGIATVFTGARWSVLQALVGPPAWAVSSLAAEGIDARPLEAGHSIEVVVRGELPAEAVRAGLESWGDGVEQGRASPVELAIPSSSLSAAWTGTAYLVTSENPVGNMTLIDALSGDFLLTTSQSG
jgi:hypothetical protein